MFLFDSSNQIVVMAHSKHRSNNKTSSNVTANRKYPNLLTLRSNSVSGERSFSVLKPCRIQYLCLYGRPAHEHCRLYCVPKGAVRIAASRKAVPMWRICLLSPSFHERSFTAMAQTDARCLPRRSADVGRAACAVRNRSSKPASTFPARQLLPDRRCSMPLHS